MWCINGAFSVLGGVLALAIAMVFSFSVALLSGGLIYVGIFFVGRSSTKGALQSATLEESERRQERELEKLLKKQRRKQWKEKMLKKRRR